MDKTCLKLHSQNWTGMYNGMVLCGFIFKFHHSGDSFDQYTFNIRMCGNWYTICVCLCGFNFCFCPIHCSHTHTHTKYILIFQIQRFMLRKTNILYLPLIWIPKFWFFGWWMITSIWMILYCTIGEGRKWLIATQINDLNSVPIYILNFQSVTESAKQKILVYWSLAINYYLNTIFGTLFSDIHGLL